MVLAKKALEALRNPDVTVPRLDGDAEHYGDGLPGIVTGVLSATEACLKAFTCPEAVLEWRLGGNESLILMTRILAFLAPLCVRDDDKTRFERLASHFHSFVILILIARRSLLNVKCLVDGHLSRVALPPTPLTHMIDQWELGVRSCLSAFFTAMDQDDMAHALAMLSRGGVLVKQAGVNEIFHRITALPWYQIPGRSKPWMASITASMPVFLSAAEWLKQVNLSSASIPQVCHVRRSWSCDRGSGTYVNSAVV